MQKYFFPPGKHTNFHQGHKVFKAKGHMVIKARGQENLKPIFCTFYSSVSPFHPLLRHNIPNITEPMEIANCASAAIAIFHVFATANHFSLENSWCQLQLSGRWQPVFRRKYRPVDDERWFTDETNWCRLDDKLVRCWCVSCMYITQQLPYKSTKIVPYKNIHKSLILDECLT